MPRETRSERDFLSLSPLLVVGVLVGLFGLQPSTVAAQTGSITGSVVSAETGQPVANAEVRVEGTALGTLTNDRGNFLLVNVSAGTHTVGVTSIGYGAASETVIVEPGGTARLDVRLEVRAVALDEVVVSGQATGKARREIGTSVASIDAEELVEHAPIMSTTQLLQSRSPGVTILSGGGNAGQGSNILLRGVGSLTQSNEPIIYVDGVRIDNSRFEGYGGGGAAWSGLDDIPPEDIARIEIIKGAAAATLYGTEASAGVIQIFTKQGRGEPQSWSLSSEFGVDQTPQEWWDVSIYSPWYYNEYVGKGNRNTQTLSVRGSVSGFSYSASGTLRSQDGMLPNSETDAGSFRANMRFTPSDRFSLNVNTSYMSRGVQQPQATSLYGYSFNGLGGGERGVYTKPELSSAFETRQNSSRFTAGASIEHSLGASFNHRLVFGTDLTNYDNFDLTHWNEGIWPRKWHYRRGATNMNLEYGATLNLDLTSSIESKSAFGLQVYARDNSWLRAVGYGMPGPVTTIDAMSVRSAGESKTQEKSAGFYGEQQLGFQERLYVTVGARADGHSAFGEDFSYALYPKADASYVVSSHDFWPEALGSLRLRGAWGTAGKQPATFASMRSWTSITALPDEPGFTTGNLGNPDLAPEVSVERELGFDAGLLDERLEIEFTYYDQKTRDALYAMAAPPSQGFIGTQLYNVGEVANQGTELAVRGVLVRSDAFRWEATASYATNHNEVVSLGDAPAALTGLQQIREGFPVRGFFGDRHIVVDGQVGLASELLRDENGELPENWDYLGSPYPERTLNLGTNLRFGRGLSVHLLADHKGGYHLYSGTMRYLTNRYVRDGDEMFEPGTPVANWCREPADARMEAVCETNPSDALGNFVQPADNWHLREVGVSYRLPSAIVGPLRVRDATLFVAARNAWRSQEYMGLEADANRSTSSSYRSTLFDTPIPRQFVAKLNVQF